MPEHQCKPHPSTYGYRGIGGPRIDRIVDPKNFSVIALTMHIPWMEQRRIVWLDGRPHPPEYAAHTWQGFSTGRWEGETLVVDTTHLKAGWIRRNGLALSDKATMREYFIRHGNTLTHTYVISDPYYLSEPMIKTSGFQLANNDNLAPYPCQAVEEVDRPPASCPAICRARTRTRTSSPSATTCRSRACSAAPRRRCPSSCAAWTRRRR